MYLRDAKTGVFKTNLVFRKADHFSELADDYNGFMAMVDRNWSRQHIVIQDSIGKLELVKAGLDASAKQSVDEVVMLLKQTLPASPPMEEAPVESGDTGTPPADGAQ